MSPDSTTAPLSAKPGVPAVLLHDVHKCYDTDVVAVNGVSLEVAAKEVVVIIGPSGCGKSTLLRCINGLEGIQGGTISLNGTVLTDGGIRWSQIRQKIGMVFQNYDLFGHLNVLNNLILGPVKVQNVTKKKATARAEALLERVGLADRSTSFPRQLSGGQRQRVAIVRALMMQPQVLLLDEITASLDPEMVREVLDVVLELASEGMTMLIVTHEMEFARTIADRVVFMDEGKIIEIASPQKFFTQPSSERAKRFLDIFKFNNIPEGDADS